MTIGIYLLQFSSIDPVYIGQSVHIEKRYRDHILSLKSRKANYKMLDAYDIAGLPTLEILEVCSIRELTAKEIEYIGLFDSIKTGLNVASGGDIHRKGENNGAARYSNEQIRKVFFLLLDPRNKYIEIEKLTDVSESTIRHIANGDAHVWLKEEYPEEYAHMLSITSSGIRKSIHLTASAQGISYPPILSPDGVIYNVTCIAEFCRIHKLDTGSLGKVLRKAPRYKSHKGWKLVD